MLSSVVLDLRLIGFEAAQSSSRCRRLGDPVAAANSFKLALSDDLHRHPDLPVIRPLCRAAHRAKGTGFQTNVQFPVVAFISLNDRETKA